LPREYYDRGSRGAARGVALTWLRGEFCDESLRARLAGFLDPAENAIRPISALSVAAQSWTIPAPIRR